MPTNRQMQSTFSSATQQRPQAEPTMFDRFGIDPRNEEQILQERVLAERRAALARNDQSRESYYGEHDIEDAGAALGALVKNKFSKPELTPEQKTGQAAKIAADARVQAMEKDGLFAREDGSLDVIKKTDAYQMALAGELIKAGDPRGVDMAREMQERQRADEVYAEAREEAGLRMEGTRTANDRAVQGLEKARFDFKRQKFLITRGEMAPIYVAGSDNPNSSILAFIDDEGVANTMDENGQIMQVPMGSYTTVRPEGLDAEGEGSGKGYIPTPTEQKDFRTAQRTIMTQIRLADVMVDSLSKSMNADGTLDIMDGSGKFNAFAVNLANNVNAIVRQGQGWIGLTDGDPDDPNSKVLGRMDGSIAGSMAYVKKNAEYMEKVIAIPDTIRQGSIQAQRYQAAVVQMAYAKARANEPGARQLSDNDFKNAIKQIGAAATDPDALREILLDNVEGAGEDFQFWADQLGEERAKKLIAPKAWEEYRSAREAFDTKFKATFGTPEKPTGALTPDADTSGTEDPLDFFRP